MANAINIIVFLTCSAILLAAAAIISACMRSSQLSKQEEAMGHATDQARGYFSAWQRAKREEGK